MPKLLFVGIIERACRATIIREIPGISDCFQVKDDTAAEIKVGDGALTSARHAHLPLHWLLAHDKRVQSAWDVGIYRRKRREHPGRRRDLLERHLRDPEDVRRRDGACGDSTRDEGHFRRVQHRCEPAPPRADRGLYGACGALRGYAQDV